MTGAAFDALPYEREIRQELFEGECVEMPSTTPEHWAIVTNLAVILGEDWRNLDMKKIPIPRPPAFFIEVYFDPFQHHQIDCRVGHDPLQLSVFICLPEGSLRLFRVPLVP